MAVPKRKHSSSRRDLKRAATTKLEIPAFSTCTNCGELKAPHRVCDLCGYYKGEQVVVSKQA